MRTRRDTGLRNVIALPLERSAGMHHGLHTQCAQACGKISRRVIERDALVVVTQRVRCLYCLGSIAPGNNQLDARPMRGKRAADAPPEVAITTQHQDAICTIRAGGLWQRAGLLFLHEKGKHLVDFRRR